MRHSWESESQDYINDVNVILTEKRNSASRDRYEENSSFVDMDKIAELRLPACVVVCDGEMV